MSSAAADIFLALRMLAWRVILRAARPLLPLPRLVRFTHRKPSLVERDPARELRIAALAARYCSARLGDGTCLDRSLLAYRFLSGAGAEPRLVIGVSGSAGTFAWHAWVTVDGHPVHEPRSLLDAYAPVVVFGHDGARETPGGSRTTDHTRTATVARPMPSQSTHAAMQRRAVD